jgi:hypothetical protein
VSTSLESHTAPCVLDSDEQHSPDAVASLACDGSAAPPPPPCPSFLFSCVALGFTSAPCNRSLAHHRLQSVIVHVSRCNIPFMLKLTTFRLYDAPSNPVIRNSIYMSNVTTQIRRQKRGAAATNLLWSYGCRSTCRLTYPTRPRICAFVSAIAWSPNGSEILLHE